MSKKYFIGIMLIIIIIILSANNISATDSTQTDNDDVQSGNTIVSYDSQDTHSEYSVSNSKEFDNVINTIKKDGAGSKTTINLNDGQYDAFNLNWDKNNGNLEINGNNQTISANINLNVGKTSKLILNSLTLNHTGKGKSVVHNNGTLILNDVYMTNSHIVDLDVISLNNTMWDDNNIDQFYYERENVVEGRTYPDSTAISIENNNRLFIDNSYFYGNVINSSLITNNYLTSISNSNFENNYANSLFTNNGKLRVMNTNIKTNYLYSLVSILSDDHSFEPETYISNSNISYVPLRHPKTESYIVEKEYFSTVLITGSYMSDLIEPYLDRYEGKNFHFVGRKILYNNSDSYFNNIKSFTKEFKNYLNNYTKQFNNYFDNKEVPGMTVNYDALSSRINVNLKDRYGNSVDSGLISVFADSKEIEVSDNEVVNGSCDVRVPDTCVINSADEIVITYNGNEKYSPVSQYYDFKYYTTWEYDTCIRELPGMKEADRKISINERENDHIAYNPQDTVKLEVEYYNYDDEIPEKIKLVFYLDNEIITNGMEFIGYNSSNNMYYYDYTLPANISTQRHKLSVKNLNPEYKSSEDYLDINMNSDDDEPKINSTINISQIYREGKDIIIEGKIIVDNPDYVFTEKIYMSDIDDIYDFHTGYEVDYFTGQYKVTIPFAELNNGTNRVELEYIHFYLDMNYINPIQNVTIEINKKNSGLTLKNYTLNDVTTIVNDTWEIMDDPVESIDNRKDIVNTIKDSANDRNIEKGHSLKAASRSAGYKNINRNSEKHNLLKVGSNLTLKMLNSIFGVDFSNQTLLIYIDDKLVFNDTVTDNLLEVLFKILEEYGGEHTLKVVSGNDTRQIPVTIK